MKKIKLFLAAMAAMVTMGVQAQLTDGTVYWIQDIGTGQFISGGASWGTRSTVKDVGGLGFQATYVSDGVYTLKNVMLNKVHNLNKGLGDNLYVDNGSPANWTLTASGDGYLVENGGKYLCNNGTENALMVKDLGTTTDASQATVWKFLTKSEYDAAIQAYKDGKAAAIATSFGVSATTVDGLETLITDVNQFVSKDLTSSISNASLADNWNGWTHAGTPGSNRGEGAGVGSGCAEFWNGCGYATQTISDLPTGLYKIQFAGTYRPGNANPAKNVPSSETSSPAFAFANSEKVELIHWIDVPAQANNREGIKNNKAAYNNVIYTYVSDGTLKIGVVSDYWNNDNNYQWCPFGQFTLTYYTNQVSDEDAAALIAAIPTGKMSDATQATLNAAAGAFETNKTIANYNALSTAIAAANISIAEYATIASGSIPTNVMDGWAKSTPAGDFHVNTWSTEGDSDGSGMTTPFMEDWVSAGNALGAGRVYYTFTDLNPGETYVVTARVRVFNEAATGVTGATYFVGNSTKSMEQFGSACTGNFATKGKFAVLSCAGVVDENGDLQFGVELADGSPINWVAIKDVTIAEGTGAVPTSIELDKTSVNLTTGGFTKLNATIAPANADDKTILWSSSDESVAIVSGGNVVALKAGTATITANAYAGTNVNATATVSVTDAAAPAFFSTTIAAEDYYIMNAATGAFLGGANAWGTQASLIEHGTPFTATVGEGTYTLDSHIYNNANDHFVNGTYVDGASTDLYITSLGDGKFSISTADGSAYLTALAGSTVVSNTAANTDSKLAQWYFISKKDRDKMLAAATPGNPVDATYYIKQANISRNLSAGAFNLNAWNPYSNAGGDNSNFNFYKADAATDVWQTIEGIPNGTYTLKMQGCTTGSATLWANTESVEILANDGDITDQASASTAFSAGKYVNTLENITVTDRTLTITVKSDDTDKILAFDNFELYLTSYTANTGVSASIDKAEIEAGTTAQITAATEPATASFNAITYTSSDEAVATVNENGVVNGVGIGSTTITVAANEMESFTTTINVTVKATAPTAFALSETSVALDKDNQSATLTITPTPAAANTSATWVSSDESVATVADGVITAVSSGSATITATSTVDPTVGAEATVTVTFPESSYYVSSYVNNDATRTVTTLGENLIKNGTFEYPDALYGWTAKNTYSEAAAASNFTITATGGVNDGAYITTNAGGGGAATSLSRAIPVEAGKKYYFAVYTSGKAPASNNYNYNALFKLKNDKSEDGLLKAFEWPQGAGQTTSEWSKTEYIFTADAEHPFIGVRMSWNENTSFDNFVLAEITSEETIGNVQYALDAIPTANIGTGAFQYSQDAIDAANALVQGTATVAEVEAAYEAVTSLNAPDATQAYNLVFNCEGHSATGNALTLIPNPAQTQGLYGLKYLAPANVNLAQAFYFVHTTGNKYKIFAVDTDGNDRYITTQAEGYGTTWYEGIRTIDDASKAMEIEIRPNGEGLYLLWNTGANKAIAHNGTNNNDFFTNNTANFQFVETQKPSIDINTTAAGWGTTILPFAVASLPSGVKVYSVSELSGSSLTLVEVTALEANKPYIIEGAWDETLTGDAQGTALTYTEGLLTGTYVDYTTVGGEYVMQKQGDKVGFFQVGTEDTDAKPVVRANRAYLTTSSPVKAFYFEDAADAIKGVFDSVAAGEIYDLAGRKVQNMQKGNVYIVNGKKVIVK